MIGRRHLPLLSGDEARRRLERGHDDGAIFVRQYSHQLEHSVLTPPCPDATLEQGVAGSAGIVDVECLPHAAADACQLSTRRVERNERPQLVIVGSRHLGDCADLVERQTTVCKCAAQQWQRLKCVAGANHLAAGPDIDTGVDGQPVRARAHAALGPATAAVQFRAQVNQLRGGRMNARCEHADTLLKLDIGDILH